MDYTEIKFELSKVCIMSGTSIDTAKKFLEWITEKQESKDVPTMYDNIPIEEFAKKTRASTVVRTRCWQNNINTVGDLLRCGGAKFRTFRLVGNKTVSVIDDALYEQYDIENWWES